MAGSELPAAVDFLIVGAGVIGSFAALELARMGHEVVVLERKVPGTEASGTNAGSLGVQNKPVRLARLALMAISSWREFEAETELDAGYHQTGGLRVAETETGVARLRKLATEQRAAGLPIEHLTGDEVRRRAPYISESVRGANYCMLDGHNNALTAGALVARAAQSAGARVYTGVEVTEILADGDDVSVRTSVGRVACGNLVLTAGIWGRDFLLDLGLNLPVILRNNQMMVTEPARPILEHVVFHVDGHLTLKQVYPARSCLVGGGWPGTGDFRAHRKETQLASTIGNAAVALRIIPSLASLRVLRSWSGFDWRTFDQMPVIGAIPGVPKVHICTSCFGGYTLSPILGRGLATAAALGSLPAELEEFTPERTVARAPVPKPERAVS